VTPFKSARFPRRIPFQRLKNIYASIEAAFATYDYAYVARFGADNPELWGCALIMLGNRIGGERILDRHNISTAQACLYRAFAAWQYEDAKEARRWIAEGRKRDQTDPRFDRLDALMKRSSFRIVLCCGFHEDDSLAGFQDLPDFDVVFARQLQGHGKGFFLIGDPVSSVVPPGQKIDFVLLDDLMVPPIGMADLGAPVIVNAHDHEWYYEYAGSLAAEIDLVTVLNTSEAVELNRGLGLKTAFQFFPMHIGMAPDCDIAKAFASSEPRSIDLLQTGTICSDPYRHKRREILNLTQIDNKFSIKFVESYFRPQTYWQLQRDARFSMTSCRASNLLGNRPVESLSCGTLHMVEEDNAFPYLFSEMFHCFPVYRNEHVVPDIEAHLYNYEGIIGKLRPQLPQLHAEFSAMFQNDQKARTQRCLRSLLFLLNVQGIAAKKTEQPVSKRTMTYCYDYDFFLRYPDQLKRIIEQTPPPHFLRQALAKGRLALAQNKTKVESLKTLTEALQQALKEIPDSLAINYTLGMCLRLLDCPDEAEPYFAAVTEDKLRLYPHEPVTTKLGWFNSPYWVCDARIREACAGHVEPLVSVKDVWTAYAWANRADIILQRALNHHWQNEEIQAEQMLRQAAEQAKKSIEIFPYNDAAQRVYLRAAFALSSLGYAEWGDDFIESFTIARDNDALFLHDFAACTVHLLMERRREAEAHKIKDELDRFLQCATLHPWHVALYPEAIPLLYKYKMAHSKLQKIS
jgi:hypothetical protein